VGIARALLADAPIVLLDEPTSGLDADAERLVIDALRRLVVGRTVVMTTHRPALLDVATRTVRLTATSPTSGGRDGRPGRPKPGGFERQGTCKEGEQGGGLRVEGRGQERQPAHLRDRMAALPPLKALVEDLVDCRSTAAPGSEHRDA
jgi:energy-coupling factor transporter ATP-binding protein EcfA2